MKPHRTFLPLSCVLNGGLGNDDGEGSDDIKTSGWPEGLVPEEDPLLSPDSIELPQ